MQRREVLKFQEACRPYCLTALLILAMLLIFSLQGCSGTIESLKDPKMDQGCVVIEAGLKLGYFNQEGQAEACKLKCSTDLPDNFFFCERLNNEMHQVYIIIQ